MGSTKVFLVDGTYELFRSHFGAVRHRSPESLPTAGLEGVLGTVLGLLEQGATHVGVATDHVVESFRNALWPGYKTGEGIDPVLRAQFTPLEEALEAMGVVVWPMVDVEADDALASAAAICHDDPAVEQVCICTVDKDLGQCVVGAEVVQWDRRKGVLLDEAGVEAKLGVPPRSVPDYLALVGDSADGFPGLPGFGARSAGAILRRFGTIEAIPDDVAAWSGVDVRGAGTLCATLASRRDDAMLFKRLATLVVDRTLLGSAEELRWRGPTPGFAGVAEALGARGLAERADRLAAARA